MLGFVVGSFASYMESIDKLLFIRPLSRGALLVMIDGTRHQSQHLRDWPPHVCWSCPRGRRKLRRLLRKLSAGSGQYPRGHPHQFVAARVKT